MKTFLLIASLFILAGCETLELQSVTVGTTHYVHPHNYIRYSLGYYTSNHYHGYRVHGHHGHRYYYAPRHWNNHHYYARPPVVVHRHVHTHRCYSRGGHMYTPPRPRHNPRVVPPNRPRVMPHDERRHDRRNHKRHDRDEPRRRH
jgi:hypothetical protein